SCGCGSPGLSINGHAYTLEPTVLQLISAANANPAGFYALTGDDDDSGDGTCASSPIASITGVLNGLGHSISGLSVISGDTFVGGLVANNSGEVSNFSLLAPSVFGTGGS